MEGACLPSIAVVPFLHVCQALHCLLLAHLVDNKGQTTRKITLLSLNGLHMLSCDLLPTISKHAGTAVLPSDQACTKQPECQLPELAFQQNTQKADVLPAWRQPSMQACPLCVCTNAGARANGDTSPRKAFARKVDIARPGDHPDVLRYRYSNGLCPDVYQVP